MLAVVVPVLDEAAAIVASLQGLQVLRGAGARLVVVDGGSADATRELAAPWADAVIVSERGRARQLNAGAASQAACGASALLFLHADTRLPEDALAQIDAALQTHAWGRFDVCISGASRWLRVVARMMNWRSRLTGIATGDQAIFVRAEAFRAIGGFAPIALMEDIELCKRLLRSPLGGPPACLRARVVTSGRRWERHGIARTIALMWWLRLAYFLGASPDRLARWYRHAR